MGEVPGSIPGWGPIFFLGFFYPVNCLSPLQHLLSDFFFKSIISLLCVSLEIKAV